METKFGEATKSYESGFPASQTRFPPLQKTTTNLSDQTPYFHRVKPSAIPCSNSHLQCVAKSEGSCIYAPSQLASQRRLNLLVHLLRHECSLEYLASLMPFHTYRILWGDTFRRGRPGLIGPNSPSRKLIADTSTFPIPPLPLLRKSTTLFFNHPRPLKSANFMDTH